MRKAPIAWRPILNMSTISNSKQLLACVIEHSKAVISATKTDQGSMRIPTSDLITVLRSIGIEPPQWPCFQTPRSVNLASGTGLKRNDLETDLSSGESYTELEEAQEYSKDWLKSAFQVLKTRQCPPPKQYYFPVSHKETKLGKLPPSPCKVCSSPKHCDKECPHWDAYLKQLKRKTTLILSLQVNDESNLEDAYHVDMLCVYLCM